MSSVDPRWGPPGGAPGWPPPVPYGPPPAATAPRSRRPAWVYLLAVALPVALLATLLLPLGAAALWRRVAAEPGLAPGSGQQAPPGGAVVDGSRGLGDPYYPDAGNGGYDVSRYRVGVTFDPSDERLSGTTTISARALQGLHSFVVDLRLDVSKATVDGADAGIAREGASDWRITPATPVEAGRDFTVVVTYAGNPVDISGTDGAEPFTRTGEEWLVAGEPESAAWWFPSNDHPSDPALMDISIRVPRGLQAISTGRLVSADSAREDRWDTWHWVSRQPMATFLTFMAIGSFTLRQGVVDGLPYVYAVTEQLSAADQTKAFAALQSSAQRVRVLAGLFGPYPFTELGGVVPAAKVPFDGLETQTRPVYRADAITDARYAGELVTHELAHMWFGDNVTVRQWNDIFDSEAYASWAAWAYAEKTGGATAQSRLTDLFARARDRSDFWSVTMIDPGRRNMFTTVYYRGPMALQALRNVMGDQAFTRLSTEWAQDPGSRSLEDWMAKAQALTPTDLGPFFQAWILADSAPAETAANGLG